MKNRKTFETKCIKCGKLLTINFVEDDDGSFYCSVCEISFYINKKGKKIIFDYN